ncbi:MAG TPA: hypothetical protein VFG50_04665 [Rhodothermales bacterium]|nr:hypothetical protein [Rhodothermales bacterium]
MNRSLRKAARSIKELRKPALCVVLLAALCIPDASAQVLGESYIHQRGRIWEEIWNTGLIGDGGAWDYLTSAPLGMFPGFEGYSHPVGNEFNAVNTFSNANFHNFHSGIEIAVKGIQVPDVPPGNRPKNQPYALFSSGMEDGAVGIESIRKPTTIIQNYMEEPDFNPLLAEEMTEATWNTNVGITVTRRSYVWSYPGYSDFIIYDYVFKNTGQIVSDYTGAVVPNTQDFQQTLNDVYFAFHSAISVSTKSTINFHSELTAVQAGAFGWKPPYHDYYHIFDDGALVFSTNYNGGARPTPFDTYPIKEDSLWTRFFGHELESPAAYGWEVLSAASLDGSGPRTSPAPDVLRIDTHKGGTFDGASLDLEFFNLSKGTSEQTLYKFFTTPSEVSDPGTGNNDGTRFNFYTQSYGPYTLAPGDSVRFVIAEIAGVMDYKEVNAGDPDGHFPDSTIAAIQRNAELARNAVAWGLGADVNGVPLAADAPEPPPMPQTDAVNASEGIEKAAIAVTWDNIAETTTIADGSGAAFYSGAEDLDGYRVYRSQDFQYDPAGGDPVFRGAAWTLLKDIPKAEMSQYWDEELQKYSYVDETVKFGQRYGYYVAAYNDDPGTWTSANNTQVNDLPTLESGSARHSAATSAVAGPVTSLDVYVVPNPYVFGDADRSFGSSATHRIEFRNLPERATIRIYTVSGDLIRTIEHGPDERGNLFGTAVWDQKSDSGLQVSPGLYIYHVESRTEGVSGGVTGKLMIIR